MKSLSESTKGHFRDFGIVLPSGGACKPSDTFPGDDTSSKSDAQWLFKPATDLAIHVKTVETMSQLIGNFIDEMSQALIESWNQWQGSISFSNIVVNAGVGILLPTGMSGNSEMGKDKILDRMDLKDQTQAYKDFSKAIATAAANGLNAWCDGFSNPALPFPAAMIVGPLPPTPNVPLPLSAGMSPGDAMMVAPTLSKTMAGLYGRGAHSTQIFEAFAKALADLFTQWKAQTQITNILAKGGAGMPAAGATASGGSLLGPPLPP